MGGFEDTPQQVDTSGEQLSQLKAEYECVQSEKIVSAIGDVGKVIIEDQKKIDPLTQDNILSVINKWNNMFFQAFREAGCNFPKPPEYINMFEVAEDTSSKAIDLYFQSQGYHFGYAEYIIDGKYIASPTVRKVEEEQIGNLSDFFQEWEKYGIDIVSLDIPIIFYGFDETGLSTELNVQEEVILQGTYSEGKVEIFRGDTRNFHQYFDPNLSETQLRRREHNTVADEMGHALFDNSLGLQDEIASDKIFVFRGQEYTTFQLNEFCSMLSSLRFGADKLESIHFLLGASPKIQEFQYDLGKTLFHGFFGERQGILGLSDIYEYIDYCSGLSEDELDSEVEVVLQKAEHIFFYQLLPLLKG